MAARTSFIVGVASLLIVAGSAAAQSCGMGMCKPRPDPSPVSVEEAATILATKQASPAERERLREWNKRRVEAEKQMKTIRFKYFGGKVKPETRQAGILELRTIVDPAAFPSMIELYRDEKDDVLRAVCEHLADQNTPESITTLAYIACNEKSTTFRAEAMKPLAAWHKADKPMPEGVHTVVAAALAGDSQRARNAAASLVKSVGLIEAIPGLIAGQISVAGGGGSAGGYIAWIAIGTQRAYVADLTPITGDGVIGFDPVPGILTEGVVLAINDAVAVQYNVGVHDALVGMTSELSGQDTSRLGWNVPEWKRWYANEFLPQQKAKAEAAEKAKLERDATKKVERNAKPKPFV